MGCDIHTSVEVRTNGKWYKIELDEDLFDWRSYGIFGFLGNVRNYSNVPSISDHRGLPEDSEWLNGPGYYDGIYGSTQRQEVLDYPYNHSHSYVYLKELLDFNYDQEFEDLRYTETIGNTSNSAAIAEKGFGTVMTIREFLGKSFFKDIEKMSKLGHPKNVRLIFWFDN